ncbi:MAG: radical SAM protein, partial [Sedimentisphaerales bacterium]|nr:radical SAM protein [Sedimentisphaerales bacterium]
MNTSSLKQQDNFAQGFNVIAKPIGPVCNLDCKYCFYKEKHALFPKNHNYHISDEILEEFTRRYIESQPLSPVPFVWQGGEPTLLGLDFFRKAVRFQKKYAQNKQITNSLQTNGTLLDDSWCEFLAQNNFLVGISIDGPEDIHNVFRADRKGRPTFDTVMRGLDCLKKHQVEFNALCCVAKHNEEKPLDVYRFFKEQGVRYIQFIPVAERHADKTSAELGFRLAAPSDGDRNILSAEVTEWSVEPAAYGDFLIRIFNQWVRSDVGSVFIMNFEWALSC